MLKQNLYILIFSVLLAAAKRNYRLEIETFTCKNNDPLLIGDVGCSLRRDRNDNITKASMFIYLKKQINAFEVQYILKVAWKSAQFNKLIDTRINACEFLQTQQKQKLFQYFLETLRVVTNVELQCPFKAPFNYTITDYYMDINKLPPSLPIKRFRVSYLGFYQKRLVLNIFAMGSFNGV